jgi:LysM repeat protein
MTTMPRFAALLLLSCAAALFPVLASCGDDDNGAGQGQRVTDPARVPSSTPISKGQPQVYQINQDGSLTISGGEAVTGDTCGAIASDKGITVAELIAANRATINADCTNLRPGDELKIPAKSGAGATTTRSTGIPTSTPRAGNRTYTVASGDTCSAIAANQGVKVADLIAVNSLDPSCANLQVGQVLKIPG